MSPPAMYCMHVDGVDNFRSGFKSGSVESTGERGSPMCLDLGGRTVGDSIQSPLHEGFGLGFHEDKCLTDDPLLVRLICRALGIVIGIGNAFEDDVHHFFGTNGFLVILVKHFGGTFSLHYEPISVCKLFNVLLEFVALLTQLDRFQYG